ncbi:MAG: Stp1/IreP family PP2C-type Ser/Thr phosphatase [Clostridiales bacterium]|nr:Stp1/IreP family PP2C-type Ser/Thr phosphatase [Clostridiales bacterium]
MSHKFRFSKESKERLKSFFLGEKYKPVEEETPAEKPSAEPRTEAEAVPAAAANPAGKGKLIVAARTDIGKMRKTNQDALVESPADHLWGVADGMGGHNGGETASCGARDGLLELLSGKEPEQGALRTAIGAVNRRLFLQQKEDEKLSGMGTTLTVLWLSESCVYIGHVGDSRAYRLREGEFTQITEDHSVVAELLRSGMITPEQAAAHPMRNVITRAVGTEDGIEIDLLCEERRKGDVWLVCSDGLYGMVGDEKIAEILKGHKPEKAADLLVKAALEGGGRDNISLVILLDKEGGV